MRAARQPADGARVASARDSASAAGTIRCSAAPVTTWRASIWILLFAESLSCLPEALPPKVLTLTTLHTPSPSCRYSPTTTSDASTSFSLSLGMESSSSAPAEARAAFFFEATSAMATVP